MNRGNLKSSQTQVHGKLNNVLWFFFLRSGRSIPFGVWLYGVNNIFQVHMFFSEIIFYYQYFFRFISTKAIKNVLLWSVFNANSIIYHSTTHKYKKYYFDFRKHHKFWPMRPNKFWYFLYQNIHLVIASHRWNSLFKTL